MHVMLCLPPLAIPLLLYMLFGFFPFRVGLLVSSLAHRHLPGLEERSRTLNVSFELDVVQKIHFAIIW